MDIRPSTAATAPHSQNALPDNPGTSNSPSVERHIPSSPPAPGLFQSGTHFMRRFNFFAPQKPFGPLTFLAQLESNMRQAGCSKSSITKFNELFGNPDPQSLYAQNILADLQANRYAPESVKRHIKRMRDFQEKCYSQLRNQVPRTRELINLRELRLRAGNFAALPSEIGRLTNLQILELRYNQFATLSGEIGQLTNLQTLWLGNNKLAALPGEIGQLTNLQSLWLENNKLAALPGEIGQLTNLQKLDLQNNKLAALPGEIGQLSNLQTLYLNNNQLAALPGEIGQLTNLNELYLQRNQLAALPGEIGQLTNLQTLEMNHNQLAALPSGIGQLTNLQTLEMNHNQLAALPGEIGQLSNLQTLDLDNNHLVALPGEIGQLSKLQRLWLRNNQFTTVPRVLLDFPAGTEINLQGNPLPDAEIIAVREEIERRRAGRQAVPRLILPSLAADGEDALRAAAAGDMNVHQQPLTDAFKRRLDELANQFPGNLKGETEQDRAEMKTIEKRLFAAFERHAAPHPRYRAACDVARTMFQKGYGQRRAYYNDFRYSSGHVLSYVVLAMEAQWERTPDTERDQAQENGVNNLIDFLAAGRDSDGHTFCDTRHIEEVLQMIGLPLSRHAQDNVDIIGATPVGLAAEQIREATLPVAKRTLLDLARQSPDLADDALQAAFRTALTHAMHAEHPGVTPEQLNAYLDTDILPMWDTFKELALDEEGNPP